MPPSRLLQPRGSRSLQKKWKKIEKEPRERSEVGLFALHSDVWPISAFCSGFKCLSVLSPLRRLFLLANSFISQQSHISVTPKSQHNPTFPILHPYLQFSEPRTFTRKPALGRIQLFLFPPPIIPISRALLLSNRGSPLSLWWPLISSPSGRTAISRKHSLSYLGLRL